MASAPENGASQGGVQTQRAGCTRRRKCPADVGG